MFQYKDEFDKIHNTGKEIFCRCHDCKKEFHGIDAYTRTYEHLNESNCNSFDEINLGE